MTKETPSAPLDPAGPFKQFALKLFGWFARGTGTEKTLHRVAPRVTSLRTFISNVCLVGNPIGEDDEKSWSLIDAGMPQSTERIVKASEKLFGRDTRPEAILLTHGHFDHVGALVELVRYWDVPVFAHEDEIPYLTGKRFYPKPDPHASRGVMAKISPLFPKEPINLTGRVHPLPAEGWVPGLPDWRWIHTPGHTPGHVSFFRDGDRVLIAGDAFTTVKQEEAGAVIVQEKDLSGPPAYFTPDWEAAKDSIWQLAALRPSVAVAGHGPAIRGSDLAGHLTELARNFDQIVKPKSGRSG